MNILSKQYKPYLAAFFIITACTFIINYLSVPNTLSHDKLNNELFLVKSGDPSIFLKDTFLQGKNWHFFYVPFVEFLRFANQFTGSSEATYRLMVPVSFFIFEIGMFVFLYQMGSSFLASIVIGLLSSIYIPVVLHENWGIPGPSMIVPRHLALALLPFAFFFFYRLLRDPHLRYVFLFVGLIGNIHQVSAFYVTLIFLGTFIWMRGLNSKTLMEAFIFGLWALLGIIPFLVWHLILYPSASNIVFHGSEEYLRAFWASQPHMSPQGMLSLYKTYFINFWYTFWPLLGIFTLSIYLRRKNSVDSDCETDATSTTLICATILITLGITIVQQFLQYFFNIPPILMEEPRAFKFIYFVLYLHLALFFSYLFTIIQKDKKRTITIVTLVIILIIVGIFAYYKVPHVLTILTQKHEKQNADTCGAPIYHWIKTNTPKDSLFLIGSSGYPAFRICTFRGVVYHYRDGAAIAPTSGNLIEWYRRKNIIEKAYADKNADAIPKVAHAYSADYIVSEYCIPLPSLKKIFQSNDLDCVYQLTPEESKP